MARRSPARLLIARVFLAALAGDTGSAAVDPSTADPIAAVEPTGARTWKHPSEWYPRSVRRWFEPLPASLRYSEVRYQPGDDLRWAQPGWDDSAWTVSGVWDLPARSGIEWARLRVRMGADGRELLPAGLMISTVRAYEVFWDGVQLGRNGVPGNSAETEVPGRVDGWFSIPAGLLGPGDHVVALRTSSHRCGFPARTSGFRLLVDTPAVLQGKALREAFVPTLAAGALCMTALASFILWLLAARRVTLLLLGGVCLSGAVMQALQAVRWFFAYPADWHYPVLSAMTALVGVQGVLTVALVIVHFELPRRRWLIGLLVIVFALVSWQSPERMNLEGVRILAVGVSVALLCAVWAVWQRRRGAWPVVIGVVISIVLLAIEAEDYRASFFMKFLPALVGLIASLAVRLHDERQHARAAQLAAARLETELLKKNLQPHFLLNTLAVLTEIVEQDPRGAVRLIEDLAEEFRSVARVASEKLIPLAQELQLCRAHLRVMSVRMNRAWSLETAGVDETAPVPPAIFLTLIENSFAHQRVASGAAAFTLGLERAAGRWTRYTFLAPGVIQEQTNRPAGGTGLRYVRARLEESFPGRWTLHDEAATGGWRTVIELRANGEGGRS